VARRQDKPTPRRQAKGDDGEPGWSVPMLASPAGGLEPGRLIEVHGLGPKRTKKVADAWQEQKAIKEVMVFWSGVEVPTSLAVRIYKKYAGTSISVARNQPYPAGVRGVGIGFKTADTIAAAVGIAHDSPQEIKAGLPYTLSQAVGPATAARTARVRGTFWLLGGTLKGSKNPIPRAIG
jgi:hypothetical protein